MTYQPPPVPAYSAGPILRPRPSGLAIASLVVGIIGTVLFCVPPLSLILALVGVVLGVVALIVGGKENSRGIPIAGIIASVIPFVIWGVIALGLFGAAATAVSNIPTAPAPGSRAISPSVQWPPARPDNWPSSYDPSPAQRAKREESMKGIMGNGPDSVVIFSKISGHAFTVSPEFMALPFGEKQKLAIVGYLWELDRDPACRGIFFYDPSANRRIGSFSWPGGLKID